MFWRKSLKGQSRAPQYPRRGKLTLEELEPRNAPASVVLSNPPTFSWNLIPGALHYDVWVSDLTISASPIERNTNVTGLSWTAFHALNVSHTYEWWVRGIFSDGSAGSWSAGITFTVASLPRPTLVSPVTTVSGYSTIFIWNRVAGASLYDVWIDDISTGQSEYARNTEVVGTSWTPQVFVIPGHSYRWWVRASDASGTYGGWSSAATFNVIGQTGAIPPGPLVAAPVNLGTQGSSVRPTYTWALLTGAVFYDLWVDDLTSRQTEVVRTQLTSLAFTSQRSLTAGDAYRWWVRGYNVGGIPGPWSVGVTFSAAALSTPILTAPSGRVSQGALFLTWTTATGTSAYDVWIDDLSTGQSQVVHTQVSGTSLTPTSLSLGHTYEWWVRAWTSDGGSSLWSAPLVFTIV